MRKIAVLLLPVMLCLSSLALAQEMKVAMIDTEKVLKETNIGKRITAKFRKAAADKDSIIKQKGQKLTEIEGKLRSSGSVLSESKRLELKQEYERLRLEINNMIANSRKELQKLQNSSMVDYNNKIKPVLDKFCKEKKYDLVIPLISVVWVEEKINITDEFIKRVNAEIK